MKKTSTLLSLFFFIAALLMNPEVRAQSLGLKINEVDYDQIGTDTSEFIELYNTGPNVVNLGIYNLLLFNGGNNSVYDTIQLPAMSLNPGSFFVICGNAGVVPNCDMTLPALSNIIQNGSPDAILLMDTTTAFNVDAVSYEGSCPPPYVEVTGVPSAQSDSTLDYTGMSRFPDGNDTDDNSADFHLACSTPGAANVNVSTNCQSPVSSGTELFIRNPFLVYPNPANSDAEIFSLLPLTEKVILQVSDISGKIIHEQKFEGVKIRINTSAFAGGVYTCKIIGGDRTVGALRLVILH